MHKPVRLLINWAPWNAFLAHFEHLELAYPKLTQWYWDRGSVEAIILSAFLCMKIGIIWVVAIQRNKFWLRGRKGGGGGGLWRMRNLMSSNTKLKLSLTCFTFTISLYCYIATFLPLRISFPPTHSFLPSFFPFQLDIFTSQILISKTSTEALALAPSRQLCFSQPPLPLSSPASLCLLFCMMRSCSNHFSLGLRVIQAQTEGSQTSVHTWDQDSQGHVSTHCLWVCDCIGVSLCEGARGSLTRPDH